MSSQKKYQIFVSSTHDDLIDERKEVTEAILKCDCIPAGMELWPAFSLSQWEVIKSVIDDSDYYLLIIAGKYGSEGTDDDGNTVSYTEMEYNYAVKFGKPVIALINKYPDKLPGTKIELDNRKRKKLDKFKKKVMDGRLVTFWTSIDDVKTEAVLAIQNAINKYPAGGWIRWSTLLGIKPDVYWYSPESLEEAAEVVRVINAGNVVVLNLESVEYESASRIIDFISGNIYGISGTIQKISNSIFICVPTDIQIKSDFTEIFEGFRLEHERELEEKIMRRLKAEGRI